METWQAFVVGLMVAYTPTMIVLAAFLINTRLRSP